MSTPRLARNQWATSWMTMGAVFTFVFLGFFPNPAIPLTGQLGLQFNQLMAFVLVPWIILRRPSMPHIAAVVALMAMTIVTGFTVVMSDNAAHADLAVKMMLILLIAIIVMIPAGYYAESVNLGAITLAIALAILIHVAIGLYQIQSFNNSVFPFPWIYNNSSFLAMSADQETYVTYVKRPFGLFPEPSAMGACVGPWLIYLLGVLLVGRRFITRSRTLRWIVISALVGGIYMMFQTRSGYTPLWLLSIIPVAMYYPLAKSKPGYGRIAKVFAGLVISVVVVAMTRSYVNSTLNSTSIGTNDSWAARQQSIIIGITAPSQDPMRFIFGFGPGQSATYLQTHPAGDLIPSWYSPDQIYDIQAVWSVLGTLYMENGFVGLIVLVGIGQFAVRSIWRSNARVLGYSIFLAWLFGITIATSYFPLSPLWICLAMLLVWDRLFSHSSDQVQDEVPWIAPDLTDGPEQLARPAPWVFRFSKDHY